MIYVHIFLWTKSRWINQVSLAGYNQKEEKKLGIESQELWAI
jgi:hypothetical protein